MPQPYELFICYDGDDWGYTQMLLDNMKNGAIISNKDREKSRFQLINEALELSDGEYYMHVENDFYWVDAGCLDAALNAFHQDDTLHYVRFELLPFTYKNFYKYSQVDGKDICRMYDDAPYRFTFNPHIRKFKYPTDEPFKTEGFTKQPEQHHNDGYLYHSACMTGDNWRHLGVYSEGGWLKDYYGERFFNQRGRVAQYSDEYLVEFSRVTKNPTYLDLFERYLNDNRNKQQTKCK